MAIRGVVDPEGDLIAPSPAFKALRDGGQFNHPSIEAHARYLREHAGARLTIEGNGDERGSREYNLALGQRRAEGVRQMLKLWGAADEQVEAVSFGEEKPRAQGHDESSWAQNRRSDFVYRRGE